MTDSRFRGSRHLSLEDIEDLRQYERSRQDFRSRVMATKKRRRIPIGPIVTVVFENRDTIRFQIQEMARIEKMTTDEQIQAELDVYNPLVPEPGELSATLFVELTDEQSLREWLPKLVGIEKAVVLRVGPTGAEVRSVPEAAHAEQLTREEVTASVHYIRFRLDQAQISAFAGGPVVLAVDHPAYRERTELSEETRAELLADLGD